jgi:hypothetical protein
MKTLEGAISIIINEDETRIEIKDRRSNITFAKVKLTPKQLSLALSRMMYVDCEIQTHGLKNVGKKHVWQKWEFKIPEDLLASRYHSDFEEQLNSYAYEKCPRGWVPDNYYGSKESFFVRDGEDWARVTVRKWV